MLRPLQRNQATIVSAVVCTLAPVLVETVLFVRLIAVYPFSRISTGAKIAVYGLPIAMTLARIINTSVGLREAIRLFESSNSAINGPEQSWQQKETKVECILHVIDNS